MNGRLLVIGDIHGNLRALEQCLERSHFDKTHDRLIVLGDVVDGYPDTKTVVSRLINLGNACKFILGNHDEWAMEWMLYGAQPDIWTSQGGWATIKSYRDPRLGITIPKGHREFFSKAPIYYEEDGRLFLHGGIKPNTLVRENNRDYILWDRNLADTIQEKEFPGERTDYKLLSAYKEVFIGHSAYSSIPRTKYGVWNLDTGAGWGGKLTIMDVYTHEYWQSDSAEELYPGYRHRGP